MISVLMWYGPRGKSFKYSVKLRDWLLTLRMKKGESKDLAWDEWGND